MSILVNQIREEKTGLVKRRRLKLYVWNNFAPSYRAGLAFAIARDLREAKKLVVENYGGYNPHEWGDHTVFELDSPRAFSVAGGD